MSKVGSRAILTRAVVLGLGLSSVLGNPALAANPLVLDGNTKIVGTADGEKTTIGNINGVYVEPSFSAPGGQLEMNDNTLTIQNANTGMVIGLYDMTDNTQNNPDGEFSSLTAENNRLTVTDSQVGLDLIHVHLYAPNSGSTNTIANNQATVTNSTVNGSYFGTYQRYTTSGTLLRTGNSSMIKNSTLNGHVFGSNIYEANDFQSANNVLSLSGSTVAGYLVQDSDYGTKAEMTGNQLILDDSKAYSPVMGEWFNATVSNASATAQNNNITLQNRSYAGSAAAVLLNGTRTTSEASANTVSITGGSAVLFGTPVEGDATASGNAVTLDGSQAGILAGAVVSGDANGNTVTLSGDSVVDYDQTKQNLAAQGVTSPETGLAFAGLSSLAGNSLVIGAISFAGDASHNAINVTGNVDLTNAELYGALNSTLTKPAGTGNTLRIGYDGTKGAAWNQNRVKAIGAFDKVELWQGQWGNPLLPDHGGLGFDQYHRGREPSDVHGRGSGQT